MNGKYFTSFDGAKIYYHKSLKDKNKWLIFLHGLGGDLTAWKKERSYFSKLGISTIAMDLRGHGFSERRNDQNFYKFENFAKDVEVLIEEEGIKGFILIGHCIGGIISIYFQAQSHYPSKGLILIDTTYKPVFFGKNFIPNVLLDKMIRLLLKVAPAKKANGHEKHDQFVGTKDINLRRLLSDILHTSLRSYLMIFDSLVNFKAGDLLKKIQVPTLVIEGLEDSIFPPQLAIELSSRIKNSELEFVKDADHILVINNPKDLEKDIEKFLKRINFI